MQKKTEDFGEQVNLGNLLMRNWVMRFAVVTFALSVGAIMSAASAADDADTLTVGGVRYRLDGIDAPETDQTCIDSDAKAFPCGRAAYERLMTFVAGRPIACKDVGADTVYGRRIGMCTVDGVSLNSWLVREGLAINFEPYAKGRFLADEADARNNRRGLWDGCFAAPRDFRYWRNRQAQLLGSRCPSDARAKLFPDHVDMPPGCEIKGTFSILALPPYRGIYHLPGCRSYQRLKNPQRWFCDEAEAQAAHFRKAFTCRRAL